MDHGTSVTPRKLEISLRHDGDCWVASGEGLCLRTASLQALDNSLHERLLAAGYDMPVDVSMYFEHDSLPRWMRQYGAHYFNRQVRLVNQPKPGDSP